MIYPRGTAGSPMARGVRLYYLKPSHYCVSAERMLAFKGIPFRIVPVPYHDRQELLALTGQDYVPTLDWNGTFVTWERIPRFLEEVHPQPTLFPSGREGLATVLEHWGHQVLEERVWRAVVTEVPRILDSDQERWVFEEMQTRARGPWHVLRARRKEFVEDLHAHFALVEGLLQGRSWVLDEPSIADFGIYGSLSPWRTVGHPWPARFPRLRAWARRIEGIPRLTG